MITRTLHLVDAEPSSQLCASDDDSDDDADDSQLLADLLAETQYGVSDAAIVASDMADTAIDEASDAGDEAVVASGEEAIDPSDAAVVASGVAGAEASDPSGAGVVATVAIGGPVDPYWEAAETVVPMDTFGGDDDEDDVDFYKRQAELSDDPDDSDKDYKLLHSTGCTCDTGDTTKYVHMNAKLVICMHPNLSCEHQTYYLKGDTNSLQCIV